MNFNRTSEREAYIPRACPIAVSEELSAYADGMLDGDALRRIGSHVSHCSECARSLRQMDDLRATLLSVRGVPAAPSENYWTQTYRAARRFRPLCSVKNTTRFKVGAFAAAGLAAGFAVALFTMLAPIGTRNPALRPIHTASRHISLIAARQAAPAGLNLNALIESHARMVSQQPSEDHARATYAVSDLTARASGEAQAPRMLQETTLRTSSGSGSRSVVIND